MQDLLLIGATITGMASATIANKFIYGFITASLFTAFRFLISGLFLLIKTLLKQPADLLDRYKQYWISLVTITLLTHVIPAQLKAYALAHCISSKVALIGSLDPFVTAFYSWLLFDQRLSKRQLLGMSLGFIGTCILLFTQNCNNYSNWLDISWGEVSAVAWLFLNRLGWIQAQKALKHNWFSSTELNGICMTLGGLFSLLVICLAFTSMQTTFTCTITPVVALVIFYSLYVGNVLSYTWYAEMLKRFNAVFASVCCMGIPIMMYFLGWLLLGEPLYSSFLWSFGFIFCGVLIFYSERAE
jgi:drug/metabolite transporter (DMT)-like permease